MNLSTLKPAKGSTKDRKRVGRGPGSGLQKTSGRGSKGQLQGAGFSHKRGFEGGQMPLVRRVPKRGFTNIFRTEYVEVNLERLAKLTAAEIGLVEMVAAGLIKSDRLPVKILGRGEMAAAKTVQAHKFSASAKAKIEAAGGKAVVLEV
jgi:large subunit ribosomal protein L15